MSQLPESHKGWWHNPRLTELETMERFGIDSERWEEMSQSEEGQYAQAEMVQYVITKAHMMAWERYDQEETYRREHPPGRKSGR